LLARSHWTADIPAELKFVKEILEEMPVVERMRGFDSSRLGGDDVESLKGIWLDHMITGKIKLLVTDVEERGDVNKVET